MVKTALKYWTGTSRLPRREEDLSYEELRTWAAALIAETAGRGDTERFRNWEESRPSVVDLEGAVRYLVVREEEAGRDLPDELIGLIPRIRAMEATEV